MERDEKMAVPYSITKQVSKLSGKTHYYATPQLYGTKSTKDIAKLITDRTTVTLPDVYAVLTAVGETVMDQLKSGYQVDLFGIGKLRLSLRSRNADSREEFTSQNITGARVRMLPGEDLKYVFNGMTFEFVPTRKQQEIAKAASKAGQSLEATDGDTD